MVECQRILYQVRTSLDINDDVEKYRVQHLNLFREVKVNHGTSEMVKSKGDAACVDVQFILLAFET